MDTAVVGHAATIGLHIAVLLESNHTREIVLFSRVCSINLFDGIPTLVKVVPTEASPSSFA